MVSLVTEFFKYVNINGEDLLYFLCMHNVSEQLHFIL